MDVVEIRSSIEIFSAAVLPPNLTRDTKRDMVGDDRDVNRALQFPIIEPPVCTLNIATQIIDWGLRSEEHTSELQSLMRNSYAVFCLKKKTTKHTTYTSTTKT